MANHLPATLRWTVPCPAAGPAPADPQQPGPPTPPGTTPASMRLATTATDTVAPSTISTPLLLLLLLPVGRYCIMVALWAARRTRGNPGRNQSAVPAEQDDQVFSGKPPTAVERKPWITSPSRRTRTPHLRRITLTICVTAEWAVLAAVAAQIRPQC